MYSFMKINNKLLSIVFIACICLLFSPKFNIISISAYEGAGIRIDDFILFAGFILLILSALVSREFKVTKFEVAFYSFVSAMIISYLFNNYQSRGSILYVLRFLEYVIFFYAGATCQSIQRLLKYLIWWACINAFISILQTIGFIGGMENGVAVSSLVRATGLTNNATETGMVALLIFVFHASMHQPNNVIKYVLNVTLVFAISFTSIGLSGSRFPLALLVLFYIFSLMKSSRIIFITFGLIVAISIPTIVGVVTLQDFESKDTVGANQDILSRVETLLNPGSMDVVIKLSNKINYEKYNFSNADVIRARKDNKSLLEGGADLSLLIRLTKWVYAAKSYYHQGPFYWIVGVGPGVWYNALDGGLLRILTETGIIGLLAFLSLYIFRPKYKKFDPARPMILVFYLGNIFIDHYLFYKVMSCFLLMLGAIAFESWRRKEEDCNLESLKDEGSKAEI